MALSQRTTAASLTLWGPHNSDEVRYKGDLWTPPFGEKGGSCGGNTGAGGALASRCLSPLGKDYVSEELLSLLVAQNGQGRRRSGAWDFSKNVSIVGCNSFAGKKL